MLVISSLALGQVTGGDPRRSMASGDRSIINGDRLMNDADNALREAAGAQDTCDNKKHSESECQRAASLRTDAMRMRGDAETWYRRAVEAYPSNIPWHKKLGESLYLLGRFSEAVEEYKIIVNADPNNPVYRNDLAWGYACQGVWSPAEEAESQALQLDPKNKFYRNHLSNFQKHKRERLNCSTL
jgi:tetratricopeptide (TPR) repeat protein